MCKSEYTEFNRDVQMFFFSLGNMQFRPEFCEHFNVISDYIYIFSALSSANIFFWGKFENIMGPEDVDLYESFVLRVLSP